MDIRIISLRKQGDAEDFMRQIGVDPVGIRIMAPKTVLRLVRINDIPNIAANILKQETLSLGADTAVSKDVLTGRVKKSDCLVIANKLQLRRLCEKLKRQPYGLSEVASKLKCALNNYQRRKFSLETGNFKLRIDSRVRIMGVVNMTPDSFSADGLYQSLLSNARISEITDFVKKMVVDGADIIDVGGESSRPGSKPVSLKEELLRVIPLITALGKKIKVPISIDTYKPEVARQALASGASIVNDITALRGGSKMAKIIKKYKAAVVLMHMQGEPRNMQDNPRYKDLMGEIIKSLSRSINLALDCGIDFEKIIVDPGIGFGKTFEHNLQILKYLSELEVLGRPILIGTSRKSFLGSILEAGPRDRLFGTISSACIAALNGASIVRVHDVKETKQALRVLDEVREC